MGCVFIGGLRGRVGTRSWHAHHGRHAWKHRRRWNTPSRTGRAARKGRGKERERKCTLARVRASVDKSERRRAERAFLARLRDRQPGRLVASEPVLVFEISRIESFIDCTINRVHSKKKETDRRELRQFFFSFRYSKRDGPLVFLWKRQRCGTQRKQKKVYINIYTFWWKLLFSVIRCFEVEVWKENREKKEGWKDESWRRSGDWVKLLDGKKSLTESSKWFDGSVDTVGDPEAGLSVLEIATMSGILYCWRGKRVVIGSRATRRFTTIWSKPAAR